jgi:hypothetical protein
MDSGAEPMEIASWRSHYLALLALFPVGCFETKLCVCLSVSPLSFFGNLLSYPLLLESGLKERNFLFPLLFNFALERTVRKASINQGGLELKGHSVSGQYLITESEKKLQIFIRPTMKNTATPSDTWKTNTCISKLR